jgi:hypothetical protein
MRAHEVSTVLNEKVNGTRCKPHQGLASGVKEPGRTRGPSLQGRRAEDAIQSQATAPNHGHPRFWHRGAWGFPSPSTLSPVLITARIRIGRLNEDMEPHVRFRRLLPTGSGTDSPQHQFTGVPPFRRCMLLSAFRGHRERLTHQQLSM